MALTKTEQRLVESIKSMLHQDHKLGLDFHTADKSLEAERGVEYLHEQIDDMFMVKAAELLHSDAVCQAFRKVHNYKYLDDHTFIPAMEREMISTAVPAAERQKALKFIPTIIDELRAEQADWSERDSGFNPSLDEIKNLSQPDQPLDFKMENRRLNKRNIEKPTHGDGSPARTPMKQPPLPQDGYDSETDPEDGEGN